MKKIDKKKAYMVLGITILCISIIGSAYAYYSASASKEISGTAGGGNLTLKVELLSTSATDTLVPLDNSIEMLTKAALGNGNDTNTYDSTKSCIDKNGRTACQIYKVTITNTSSVPITLNGGVTLQGDNTPNIECALMDSSTEVTNNKSCKGKKTLAKKYTLNAGSTKDYYIMIYIKNMNRSQSDSGDFNGTITFTSIDGAELKAKFIDDIIEENAAQYITNLYTNADKSTVENNNITYNYASSVSLMNDRLGGTTSSLDGGNIRYYGASPNNYIYFNCDDYDNQTSDTCELWRIIGVFDGKLKIIRNSIIGHYSWDTSDSTINIGWGINEWSQADLMKLLNPGYEDEEVGGSLYYNSSSGTCYDYIENSTTSCDFTDIGIKNDETRNKIATVTWNTGGNSYYDREIYSNQWYEKERGTEVVVPGETCSDDECNDTVTRQTTWKGEIALAYPSDYGYATDFTKCSEMLSNYSSSNDSYACRTNDWMYPVITNSGRVWGWFMAPHSYYADDVWCVGSNGGVFDEGFGGAGDAGSVAPVLYLSSDEILESGTGLSSDPYKLGAENETTNQKINATEYITNLYTEADKSTVENNSITYNYASSVSLMNDRLGGTTTSLDGGNIRYYGSNPNNYIYFNCEEYPDTNCELWHIIGVFDGKLKIIKASAIGTYSWDTSASSINIGMGINEWSQADVMKLLNPGYNSLSVGGSLYYNSASGSCYTNSNNGTSSCDFTDIGIKNYKTRQMIATVTWNTGGISTAGIYSNVAYTNERGTTVYTGTSDGVERQTSWSGKIALAYSSDYGYAADFNNCTSQLSGYSSCTSYNWIYKITGKVTDLMTPSSASNDIFYFADNGNVSVEESMPSGFMGITKNIVPTLYLNSDVSILIDDGIGTITKPYKLIK